MTRNKHLLTTKNPYFINARKPRKDVICHYRRVIKDDDKPLYLRIPECQECKQCWKEEEIKEYEKMKEINHAI